ncbi:thiol-disulfide oxidoreductase DCC family protein [Undibacterium sp. SXout7W]|uniref:thiol-disulfide oxidoreductase DCC family protein n=1 Tax=Undibacterium sp. SXout7W TaxID=3413049 RepID=UPI003BF34F57
MEKNADSQCNAATEVMFDGACPLCRTEVGVYQRIQATEEIRWIDVSTSEFNPPSGMTKEQLLRRFHLITPEGVVLSGAAAFVFVWNRLPGWRWLGMVARIPGMLFFMEGAYRCFLVIRPLLQRIAKRFVSA